MTSRALQYIEIDVDYCSLTYGVAPCTAAIPTTGDIKCFNTKKTCQDTANFTNDPVTLRFAVPTSELPADIECIPSIKSIAFDPATISLGQNLGQRAVLTVTFNDHRHSDTGEGFDKYLADRDYDPYSQGTFFGKFRARQPFLFGRPLRWINGTTDQDYADMEVRHFIVDSFSGPSTNGEYKLVAKDVLKLADGNKSLAPRTSSGFLVAGISDSDLSATLSPSGIGNSEYPASGYVAIGGSEICAFTRSGDVLTLTRHQLGTTETSHSAQDRVQLVLQYSAEDAADIIADLLENYADIDASYIPLATWQLETVSYLNRLYSAVIAQPTSVNTLISELIEQAGLSLWWNDRDQTIGLLVLRGILSDAERLTEENVIAGSLQINEQPEKRLSQAVVYFGQQNPLTSLTDKANYRSVSITTDADADVDYGVPAIKEIYSRWIPALGRTIADRLGAILIGRFRDPPRHFKGSLLRYSTSEIILARGYLIESKFIQDETGAASSAPAQITRLKPLADVIEFEADEVLFTAPDEDLSNRRIIVDANILNINLRTSHDQIYPAAVSGDEITIIVNAGVILGSSNVLVAALEIGDWPTGVIITVVVDGRIQGRGGAGGGNGNGHPGGLAVYTRFPINLAVAGELWSGGGGGAGENFPSGGGGAGYLPGTSGGGSAADGTTEIGGSGGGSGAGGGPGLAGSNSGIYSGGAAGKSIDGVSYVTLGTWDGSSFTPGGGGEDIRGPQIN